MDERICLCNRFSYVYMHIYIVIKRGEIESSKMIQSLLWLISISLPLDKH